MTQAESLDALMVKLGEMIPELLELNAPDFSAQGRSICLPVRG